MNIAEKIRKIEALIAGAKTAGEKQAAKLAKERLKKKFKEPPVEFSVRSNSPWEKKLFVAICQKHGISTYRYRGQKRTTTMVQVGKSMMDEILWPEYKKYAKLFQELTNEILSDLTTQIHEVEEEEEVVVSGKLLQ